MKVNKKTLSILNFSNMYNFYRKLKLWNHIGAIEPKKVPELFTTLELFILLLRRYETKILSIDSRRWERAIVLRTYFFKRMCVADRIWRFQSWRIYFRRGS